MVFLQHETLDEHIINLEEMSTLKSPYRYVAKHQIRNEPRLDLSFFPNLITPFIDDTFGKTFFLIMALDRHLIIKFWSLISYFNFI